MGSPSIQDHLAKELFVDKNVVTFRSLSRALGLHVNVAKNELAVYRDSTAEKLAVTYQITGECHPTQPLNGKDSVGMDVDQDVEETNGVGEEDQDEEDVLITKSVLVGEANLDSVKSQFKRISSVYIFCLSPSPIRDAGLICPPTDDVRLKDNSQGPEFSAVVGKIVGAHVQGKAGKLKTPAQVASSSRLKSVAPAPAKAKGTEVSESKAPTKEKGKAPEKIKGTGKLDFSKSKPKAASKEEVKEKQEPQGKKSVDILPTPSIQSTKTTAKSETKRGAKRKSVSALADTTDEEEPPPTPSSRAPSVIMAAHSGVWVKKGVVLSDDEDVGSLARRKLGGKKSKAEKELMAIMDVDDDHVTRLSRARVHALREEEEEEEEEEGEGREGQNERAVEGDEDCMSDAMDAVIVPKKARKKKVKKEIPVGRNGLKKKRVVGTRQVMDDKGYMVAEDYSAYESVDEEEPEQDTSSMPVKTTKTKGKTKEAATTSADDEKPIVAVPKSRPARTASEKAVAAAEKKAKAAKQARQASFANFFGPSKG